MRGRKYVNAKDVKSNMTKAQLEHKERVEKEVEKMTGLQPTPPNHLKGEASREWKRVYKELLGVPITALDRTVFETYCINYASYRAMVKELDERGYTIINSKGDRVPNPAINSVKGLSAELRSNANALGFTPDSRNKMLSTMLKEQEEINNKSNKVSLMSLRG